jgi:hypothetical protein
MEKPMEKLRYPDNINRPLGTNRIDFNYNKTKV